MDFLNAWVALKFSSHFDVSSRTAYIYTPTTEIAVRLRSMSHGSDVLSLVYCRDVNMSLGHRKLNTQKLWAGVSHNMKSLPQQTRNDPRIIQHPCQIPVNSWLQSLGLFEDHAYCDLRGLERSVGMHVTLQTLTTPRQRLAIRIYRPQNAVEWGLMYGVLVDTFSHLQRLPTLRRRATRSTLRVSRNIIFWTQKR